MAQADEPPVRTLHVGRDAAYPPLEWQGPGRKFDGFNIELMSLLGRSDGVGHLMNIGVDRIDGLSPDCLTGGMPMIRGQTSYRCRY